MGLFLALFCDALEQLVKKYYFLFLLLGITTIGWICQNELPKTAKKHHFLL